MKKTIMLGHVVGMGKISIDIELKTRNFNGMTTELKSINGKAIELSISGSYRGSGGQIYDSIPTDINDWQECFITQEQLTKLIKYWKEWHLNDINAGSDLQQQIINWFYNEDAIKKRELKRIINEGERLQRISSRYKEVFDIISNSNYSATTATWKAFNKVLESFESKAYKLNDKIKKLKGEDSYMSHYEYACILLKEHCLFNDCGYKYGHAWLFKALPPEVIKFFNELSVSVPKELNEDERWDWMKGHNIKCKQIERVSNNPNMQSEHEMDHWKVTFTNENNELITYFSTGIGHRMNVDYEDQRMKLQFKLKNYTKWFFDNGIKVINPSIDSPTRSIFKGLPKPPYPYDVLSSIISDSLVIKQYKDWVEMATEFGFDISDKKDKLNAKRIYNNCESLNYKLNDFFNHEFNLYELDDIFRN